MRFNASEEYINYTRDVPPPKLSQEDELWVEQLLRTKGLR